MCRSRLGLAVPLILGALSWPVSGVAQTAAPQTSVALQFVQNTGASVIDQVDVFWFEDGRLIFSYGNGKLFGIDVRAAMGNPAALRPTTDVKWQNFLAQFNSNVVLLAARYPGLIFPEGVPITENDLIGGLSNSYGTLALEEQIDLAGYLLQTSILHGASEEETLDALSWLAYFGGAAAGAFLLSNNNVTLPLTFPIDKGEWHGFPYDFRVRIIASSIGFSAGRHPDIATRVSLRTLYYSEAYVDFAYKDVLYGSHFKELDERANYDLRRYGLYYVGATQQWNPFLNNYDHTYLVGAQVDVIAPGRLLDTRVRTGAEIDVKNGSQLPNKYLVDVYRRQTLFHGTHDIIFQATGNVLLSGLSTFQGLGGSLRASYLLGTNVPKYSKAYTRADWDRFARIYAIADSNTLGRATRNWDARLVYAAPFEFDRALESLWEHAVTIPEPSDGIDAREK